MQFLHRAINFFTQGTENLFRLLIKNRQRRRITAIFVALIPLTLWFTIHTQGALSFSPLQTLGITLFALFVLASTYNALLTTLRRAAIFIDKNPDNPYVNRMPPRQVRVLLLTILIPIMVIISLLMIDLIAMIFQVPPAGLYDGDYQFLTSLYFGTFAVLGFSVSAYVASVRHRSLRTSEKRLEYTQQKDREMEVDKRFLEGIKLLGDQNESVRLGGIYILWEIVKDAVKALPYLEEKEGFVYFYKYKDYPITPYLVTRPKVEEERSQKRLRERYLKKNPADLAQIKAYKKAYSLHGQILSILCGHIRTLTNSENYLLDYYPSIAKEKFPKAYAERYGEALNLISEEAEEPSNEIAILFRLLSKREYSKEKTVVRSLNFKINLANAILKGIYGDQGDLSHANLRNVNFANARLNYVQFDYSNLQQANFNAATLNISTFTMSECRAASFIRAQISNSGFKFTNCIRADFSSLFDRVYFYGTTMQHTRFSYQDFMEDRIQFKGINGLPGFENCTSLESRAVIELVDKNNKIIKLHPNKIDRIEDPKLLEKYQTLLQQPSWRIPIHEAEFAYSALRRTGDPIQPGETYSGYRSLEQIKTRDNLAVFCRKFREQHQNIRDLFESLTPKDQRLAQRMFTDFDHLEISEEETPSQHSS